LIVIDGLGYEYLKNKDSFLKENLRGSISSVFLSTTACALTSLLTGAAPQQHGFTGWLINLKEVGIVTRILPFNTRYNHLDLVGDFKMKNILKEKSFTFKIKNKSFVINPLSVMNSEFTNLTSKGSKKLGYETMKGFFRQIKNSVNSKGKKYVFAYWPIFDGLSHEYGVGSKESRKQFEELDKSIKRLVKSIKGTNTMVIVTADHGFIDTPLNRFLRLENHLKLKECLTLPLCGEGRTVHCYVRPSKVKQFESYVKNNLGKYCEMYKGQDLIDKGYFGLGKPNSKLFDRVGDYILIMKENYVLKDQLEGEELTIHIGHHGGMSKQEMLVPLVVIDC